MFIGNLDIRHANPTNGTFKLVIIIHGYMNDKLRLDLVSLGDLVLAAEIFEENKGMNYFLFIKELKIDTSFQL